MDFALATITPWKKHVLKQYSSFPNSTMWETLGPPREGVLCHGGKAKYKATGLLHRSRSVERHLWLGRVKCIKTFDHMLILQLPLDTSLLREFSVPSLVNFGSLTQLVASLISSPICPCGKPCPPGFLYNPGTLRSQGPSVAGSQEQSKTPEDHLGSCFLFLCHLKGAAWLSWPSSFSLH